MIEKNQKKGNPHYKAVAEAYTLVKQSYNSSEPTIVIVDKIKVKYGFGKDWVLAQIKEIEELRDYHRGLENMKDGKT